MPYGWNETSTERCDVRGVIASLVKSAQTIPTSCEDKLVPEMKQRARDHPYCLEGVITIGGDGYPVAGRADQQPEDKGNAGKVETQLVVFLLMMVIVVMISVSFLGL